MGDGATAKAEVSGEVEGVVQAPLWWRSVLLNIADTGLSEISEDGAEVSEAIVAELRLPLCADGETRDVFFKPLLARAVSMGGGRFTDGLSDLLFSLACSVVTAKM